MFIFFLENHEEEKLLVSGTSGIYEVSLNYIGYHGNRKSKIIDGDISCIVYDTKHGRIFYFDDTRRAILRTYINALQYVCRVIKFKKKWCYVKKNSRTIIFILDDIMSLISRNTFKIINLSIFLVLNLVLRGSYVHFSTKHSSKITRKFIRLILQIKSAPQALTVVALVTRIQLRRV